MQLQLPSLPALPEATNEGLRCSVCNHASASIQQHQQLRLQWRSLWERVPNPAQAMTLQDPRGAPPQLPRASLQSLLEASKAVRSPTAWPGTLQAQRQSGRAAVPCGGLPALPQSCRPPLRAMLHGLVVECMLCERNQHGIASRTGCRAAAYHALVLTSRTFLIAIWEIPCKW